MQNEMNDKLLKDKLAAYSAPFDENAWAQMEAKLDGNKKRRGIFWWWFSSASMAAIVAAAGLLLLVPGNENASNRQLAMSSKVVDSEQLAGNKIEDNNAPNNNTTRDNVQVITSSNAGDKNLGSGISNINQTSTNSNSVNGKQDNANAAQHTVASRSTVISNKSANSASVSATKSKRNSNRASNNRASKNLLAGGNINSVNTNSIALAPNTNAAGSTTATQQTQVQEEVLFASLNTLPANLLFGNNPERELQGDKKDDGSIKLPIKKKLLSYQIGVIGGTYASFTQRQFHNKASWFVGMQHGLRIGKYVAVTNGIGFSRTAFAVNNVRNVDTFFNAQAYTISIQSIAIPVGVNVYPVSNNRVAWYIGAGVVNNIKIKEEFEFNVRNLNKSNISIGTGGTGTPFAPQDNFGLTENITSTDTKATLTDYQHGSKRYFANFYTTTGVDLKLWKGLILNTGATYQLGISKTGKQDARPMYFGGEVGLKYKF